MTSSTVGLPWVILVPTMDSATTPQKLLEAQLLYKSINLSDIFPSDGHLQDFGQLLSYIPAASNLDR